MAIELDPLQMRKILGRHLWEVPQPFGPGWRIREKNKNRLIIISCSPLTLEDPTEWVHASISAKEIPTYEDLKLLHRVAFGDKWAYQVFAPSASHINIHERVLHLWGRADGTPCMPDFGSILGGSI